MQYALIQAVLGRTPQLEISHDEFNKLLKARSDLTSLVAIEEKYDLVLENHFELEKEITHVASRDMMFGDYTEIFLWDIGNLFNRRVLNVLSSFRTYIDHTDHHISDIFGATSFERSRYINYRSALYDERAEFRIVEALRNYVQHRGLSVHKWSLGSKKVGDLSKPDFEYRVGMRLRAENLEKDGKFKRKALDDIKNIGESIDLIWLLRSYVKALSEIHSEVRSILQARSELVYQELNSARNRYISICPNVNEVFGISFAKLDKNGLSEEYYYIVPEAITYRDRFLQKNGTLVNFDRRHVSSRAAHASEHE